MTDVWASQGRILATVTGIASDLNVPQGMILTAINFPADSIDSSQAQLLVSIQQNADVESSQARILVAAKGRVSNPNLKAWYYNLDSHQFYVLRLGDFKTLIYDLATEQWTWFASEENQYWRLNVGMNWNTPGSNAHEKGSNIVVGDDSIGMLWILGPETGYDESPDDETTAIRFPRIATGQSIARGRTYIPSYEVYLTASGGNPALTGSEVTLSISDDAGHTYTSAGSITIEPGNFNQDLAWRSLGRFSAPGRLFKIEDDGAFRRIDGLDISDGSAV